MGFDAHYFHGSSPIWISPVPPRGDYRRGFTTSIVPPCNERRDIRGLRAKFESAGAQSSAQLLPDGVTIPDRKPDAVVLQRLILSPLGDMGT
jgi:hypothetical protein